MFFFCLVCLFSACNQKNESEPKATGAKSVPQIYVLFEKGKNWWSFPGKSLQDSLGVRIVEESVTDASRTAEILKSWNAREVDVLILGPGLPQTTLLSLSLPKAKKRLVLFLGLNTSPLPETTALNVDESELYRFLKGLCSSQCKTGCQVSGESRFLARYAESRFHQGNCKVGLGLSSLDPEFQNQWFYLRLDWENLLRNLLNKGHAFPATELLKISDAGILATFNPRTSQEEQKKLRSYIKKFSLDNL